MSAAVDSIPDTIETSSVIEELTSPIVATEKLEKKVKINAKVQAQWNPYQAPDEGYEWDPDDAVRDGEVNFGESEMRRNSMLRGRSRRRRRSTSEHEGLSFADTEATDDETDWKQECRSLRSMYGQKLRELDNLKTTYKAFQRSVLHSEQFAVDYSRFPTSDGYLRLANEDLRHAISQVLYSSMQDWKARKYKTSETASEIDSFLEVKKCDTDTFPDTAVVSYIKGDRAEQDAKAYRMILSVLMERLDEETDIAQGFQMKDKEAKKTMSVLPLLQANAEMGTTARHILLRSTTGGPLEISEGEIRGRKFTFLSSGDHKLPVPSSEFEQYRKTYGRLRKTREKNRQSEVSTATDRPATDNSASSADTVEELPSSTIDSSEQSQEPMKPIVTEFEADDSWGSNVSTLVMPTPINAREQEDLRRLTELTNSKVVSEAPATGTTIRLEEVNAALAAHSSVTRSYVVGSEHLIPLPESPKQGEEGASQHQEGEALQTGETETASIITKATTYSDSASEVPSTETALQLEDVINVLAVDTSSSQGYIVDSELSIPLPESPNQGEESASRHQEGEALQTGEAETASIITEVTTYSDSASEVPSTETALQLEDAVDALAVDTSLSQGYIIDSELSIPLPESPLPSGEEGSPQQAINALPISEVESSSIDTEVTTAPITSNDVSETASLQSINTEPISTSPDLLEPMTFAPNPNMPPTTWSSRNVLDNIPEEPNPITSSSDEDDDTSSEASYHTTLTSEGSDTYKDINEDRQFDFEDEYEQHEERSMFSNVKSWFHDASASMFSNGTSIASYARSIVPTFSEVPLFRNLKDRWAHSRREPTASQVPSRFNNTRSGGVQHSSRLDALRRSFGAWARGTQVTEKMNSDYLPLDLGNVGQWAAETQSALSTVGVGSWSLRSLRARIRQELRG